MVDQAPERTERDITGLLNMAGHALSNRLAVALADVDLTPRMQCVLVHALEQERTQIQLAELADLDKTTMVVTVDHLESAGYAERRPSTTDRRARIIAVTPAGERIATAGQQIVDRVHGEVLDGLAKDERDTFVRALVELVEGDLSTPQESARPVRRARQKSQ